MVYTNEVNFLTLFRTTQKNKTHASFKEKEIETNLYKAQEAPHL